jgi:cytoskeleton protein RodZ
VVVIGVYVAWWNWSGSGDRIVDTVPPPPPRIEELAAAREPAPPPEPPAVTPPPSSAAAALVPGVVPPQRPGPAPAPAAGGPTPPQAAPAPPDAPRPADGGRIVLRARGADVWIQVRERVNGPILVDRVLRPGDSYSVPNRETALVLNTGNANGLEIVLDGQPLPGGLGAGPITRRGLVLDPERLRAIPAAAAGQGAAAPQPQATAPAQAPNRGPTQPPGQAPAQIPAPQRPPAQ